MAALVSIGGFDFVYFCVLLPPFYKGGFLLSKATEILTRRILDKAIL